MDLHPIFVHFPIALLLIYGFMELLRFKKLTDNESWNYAKAGMVIIGVIFAFIALASGEGAEEAIEATGNQLNLEITEVHSLFAGTATWIFAISALGYLIFIINKIWLFGNENKYWKFALKLESIILSKYIIILVAILGIIVMAITGALGGVIVYGTGKDPLADMIYSLFF